MELFLSVLALLALLAVSQVMQHLAPVIPLPIVQIALGVAVVMLPWPIHMRLEPELFFLLFIAPLLFNDGKRTPRDELWKLRTPILLLAVGLVFVTVLVGGYFIHALIPAIPLAAAFGLAAILSPTDAVAVSAIASKAHLPKNIHRLLEGESLMNDASGLVAFKFAIAAAVTGVFSLWNATWSFIAIAAFGLVVGAVTAALLILARTALRRFGIEDASVHVLIQILTPFVLFYVAEHLGLSGILAAVAGGVVHAVEQDRSGFTTIEQKFVSEMTWDVILFSLNGLVFILLGLQIPDILRNIFHAAAYDNMKVIGYVLAIYALLIALRYAWLFLSSRIAGPLARLGKAEEVASGKALWLTSLSGVRGAVTLAGAFTIPLTLGDGSPFPERDLILFLSAGVILVSLTLASVALPLLAGGHDANAESLSRAAEVNAQIQSIRAANQAVRQAMDGTNDKAAAVVIMGNQQRLTDVKRNNYDLISDRSREEEILLWKVGLAAERKCLQRMLEAGEIDQKEAAAIQRLNRRIELVFSNRLHAVYLLLSSLAAKIVTTFLPNSRWASAALSPDDRRGLLKFRIRTATTAVEAIQAVESCSSSAVSRVVGQYRQIIYMLNDRLDASEMNVETARHIQTLEMVSIQAEREALQEHFRQGKIGRRQLSKLQFQVSIHEAEVMNRGWEPPEE